MTLAENALLSVKEARALGAGAGLTDAMLTLAIGAVSQAFEREVGFPLAATERAETYPGTGRELLTLDRFPVLSLKEVLLDGSDVTAEVTVRAASGILYRAAGWPAGRWNDLAGDIRPDDPDRRITVTYTAGYDPIPPDLLLALLRELNRPHLAEGQELRRVETPGGLKLEYAVVADPGFLLPHTRDLLQSYRGRFTA